MVAVMRSSCGKAEMKFEDDGPVEGEQLFPPDKRPKLFPCDVGIGEVVAFSPEEYHPLSEPSPLGLTLKKSPSFLELVQTALSQEQESSLNALPSLSSKAHMDKGAAADKLKASNFPASVLKIGTWEYKSRYEGDLVAKCYFAKHKLVWEVLDGALKNKIEIQWSDVVAIKANYAVEGMDALDVVLARQPLFFRETNPQPRKHTLWQPTSDFTGGQASIYRHHFLQCQQGLLGRHFEKLIQCDPRLNFLSQQQKFVLDSLHFEAKDSLFNDQCEPLLRPGFNTEQSSFLMTLPEVASPSGSQSSTKNKTEDFPRTAPDNYLRKAASPSSVMDTRAIEDIEQGGFNGCTPAEVPVMPSSMSLSSMFVHISHYMSEQATPSNRFHSSVEAWKRDLSEEMSRPMGKDHQLAPSSRASADGKGNSGCELGKGMQRKDSVGELLLNLPRVASLPHILRNVSEDTHRQNKWGL